MVRHLLASPAGSKRQRSKPSFGSGARRDLYSYANSGLLHDKFAHRQAIQQMPYEGNEVISAFAFLSLLRRFDW
jgi:hypothetical protein